MALTIMLDLSIQLWPKEKAVVMPQVLSYDLFNMINIIVFNCYHLFQGAAREDPNSDPYCPPPVGRMTWSWCVNIISNLSLFEI